MKHKIIITRDTLSENTEIGENSPNITLAINNTKMFLFMKLKKIIKQFNIQIISSLSRILKWQY